VNTKRGAITYLLCTQCENVYMTVGSEKIGLAQFPRKSIRINADPSKQGPCPSHRKSLTQ
jgi:hypothetical protein